jgi:hypothetical protein
VGVDGDGDVDDLRQVRHWPGIVAVAVAVAVKVNVNEPIGSAGISLV